MHAQVGLPDGTSFTLVLPEHSDDPVVGQYRDGQQVNDHLVNCLPAVLASPGVVVDLGCHVGTFALSAAALGHRVVAIDASASHVALVRTSARANQLEDRLSVIHAAVSDRPGLVGFRDQGLFGAVTPDAHGPGVTTVEADTVPALLGRAGIELSGVDLIKMDLEGSELRAIAGMAGSLAGRPSPMLLYESNPLTAAGFQYSVAGLRTALEALGYTSHRFDADGLHACPALEPQPEAWVDLLALTDAHREQVTMPFHGPWDDPQLLDCFAFWSEVPHGNCRSYLATTLLAHWPRFAGQPQAEEILRRLVADPAPDVRQAVAQFPWALGPDAGRPGPAGVLRTVSALGQHLPDPLARLVRPPFRRLTARWRPGS